MSLNYRDLAFQEADLMSQLHYIDTLLPEDNRQYRQSYPQLFQDEDSLFKPDCIFMGNSENKISDQLESQENTYEDKNQDNFEQYLDTFEINQFIKMHQRPESNGRTHQCYNKQLDSLECTFKPNILKRSNQIAEHLKPSFERLTNPKINKVPYKPQSKQLKKQYSRERMDNLSRPRVLKTEPNCNEGNAYNSKQVPYSNNFAQIPYNNNIQTTKPKKKKPANNQLDIAARNTLWQQQKRIKIQKLRKQQQQNKQRKQKNTFTPKINMYRGEKQAALSQFGKEGMANYFERLNQAARNKTILKNVSSKVLNSNAMNTSSNTNKPKPIKRSNNDCGSNGGAYNDDPYISTCANGGTNKATPRKQAMSKSGSSVNINSRNSIAVGKNGGRLRKQQQNDCSSDNSNGYGYGHSYSNSYSNNNSNNNNNNNNCSSSHRKQNTRVKYKQAVQQLHRKIMTMDI